MTSNLRSILLFLVVLLQIRIIIHMGAYCSLESTSDIQHGDGSADGHQPKDVPLVVWDEKVDKEEEERRCAKYGFEYDGRTTRRRLFLGSMIAEDSWDALRAVAAEGYGMLHSVSYVESNTTQANFPRKLRFTSGSTDLRRLQSLFGPNTIVTVDNALISRAFEDVPRTTTDIPLAREDAQREYILYRWKLNGMQPEDIGIVTDADETFTRDFMRAIQICDVPNFREGHNCRTPKLIGRTVVFQFAPDCIQQERLWYHPDLALGECLESIGNERRNKPVERGFKRSNGVGYRMDKGVIKARKNSNESLPLLNAADIRRADHGSSSYPLKGDYDWHAAKEATNQPIGYTGYHFHEFFSDASGLRLKYKTFGHAKANAHELPLGRLSRDVQFGVNCMMNRTDSGGHNRKFLRKHVVGGLDAMVGPIPILFQNETYRRMRTEVWRKSIEEDEARYGRFNETNQ